MKEWFGKRPISTALLISLLVWLPIMATKLVVPVQAASPAAQNGCVVIGTVGNVIIARCEDEDTGTVLYANSAGYMDFEP